MESTLRHRIATYATRAKYVLLPDKETDSPEKQWYEAKSSRVRQLYRVIALYAAIAAIAAALCTVGWSCAFPLGARGLGLVFFMCDMILSGAVIAVVAVAAAVERIFSTEHTGVAESSGV
jgi:K+-sensing histidine kinase KdpD